MYAQKFSFQVLQCLQYKEGPRASTRGTAQPPHRKRRPGVREPGAQKGSTRRGCGAWRLEARAAAAAAQSRRAAAKAASVLCGGGSETLARG